MAHRNQQRRLALFSSRLGVSLATSLWLWTASPATATTLVRLDLTTLTERADRVFVGTVERVVSHYLDDQQRYIVTDVTLRSERDLWGVPVGSTIVIRHLGGVVGELGQRVHGEASYAVGEQVLLFATQRGDALYAAGMTQGAMHIVRDAQGTARVQVDLSSAELVQPTNTGVAQPSPEGQTLQEVLLHVQALLAKRSRPQTSPPTGAQKETR